MTDVRRLFFNLREVREYRHTPPSLHQKVGKEFVWYRAIKLEVNLPPELQLISCHHEQAKRVIEEFPQLSSRRGGLFCGEDGDFVQEIKQGNGGSLGHFWEHVAAQAFDTVSSQLGYGEHRFVWRVKRNRGKSTRKRTVYDVLCFHEIQPPAEFFSLADLITGYLNAVFSGESFPLSKRLEDFVLYRKKEPCVRPNCTNCAN